MKMKTLTVNGQTFPVYDGGTVRYDEAQALTGEEKARARQNIGLDDGVRDALLICGLVPALVEENGTALAENDGTLLINL